MENIHPQKTAGGGDCAFHALFGAWDGEQFFCHNVAERRKTVAERISAITIEDKLFELVQAAIKALIMENITIGAQGKDLIRTYQAHLKNTEQANSKYWQDFENELKKHNEVIKYIDDEYINLKNTIATENVKLKFDSILNSDKTEETLKGLILSIPKRDWYIAARGNAYAIKGCDEYSRY